MTPDPDDLHARLLIELADEFSEPLAIYNETLRQGKLLSDWKLAFILSIYKDQEQGYTGIKKSH